MGFFNLKKADPLSQRARMLNAEIASLEAQIRQLDGKLKQSESHPRLRSTARPHGASSAAESVLVRDPVFEQVDHDRVKGDSGPETTDEHFNALGVRKYDLVAAWRRLQNHFHGPPANNPKLISYLAAGSIQGLRPMRYEKRVARNRVLILAVILVFVLWGTLAVLLKR
jgi:hypothetical protein